MRFQVQTAHIRQQKKMVSRLLRTTGPGPAKRKETGKNAVDTLFMKDRCKSECKTVTDDWPVIRKTTCHNTGGNE